MNFKEFSPKEIITLTDFPLYNLHILKIFYRAYRKGCGDIIPPCPVIHKKKVLSSFDKDLAKKFKLFEKENPDANYFLLDGSHKTTAATLTHHAIKAMVFGKNSDIEKAKKLVEKGELFSLTVGSTVKENVRDLKKHFTRKTCFETVQQKTKRMVEKKVLPRYMVQEYVR